MPDQMLSLLACLEQSVEVRRDNLRHAALARRNTLDQTVLTPNIIGTYQGSSQPLCDQSIDFILAVFKVEEVEDLVEWDVRRRLTF